MTTKDLALFCSSLLEAEGKKGPGLIIRGVNEDDFYGLSNIGRKIFLLPLVLSGVGDGVYVAVGVAVRVAEGVGVTVAVGVGVLVNVRVEVEVGVRVPFGLSVAV
jgi:hypothetical protein